jgi:oligoribonuclease NrnB/cAMP/cGMP phosphodiesterase (DHH superfamily)
MDGSGAAILFMHAGGRAENIYWIRAGNIEDIKDRPALFDHKKPILFVDTAPTDPELRRFLSERGNFEVLDHHKSAEPFHEEPGWTVSVGNMACGTEMFRQWLAKNVDSKFGTLPFVRLAELIDDHDRWLLRRKMSIEMPRLFAFIGQREFVRRFMDVEDRFSTYKESYWTPFEEEILGLLSRAQEGRFRNLIENRFFHKTMTDHEGQQRLFAYVVSGEVNCSELLHAYLNENPQVDVAVQINLDINKVSLRSNDRVDLSKYCALFGGGGHANSGGHPLRPDGLIWKIIEGTHAR